MEGPQFLHLLWAFCQYLELQMTLTDRKKAAHHFGTNKGGFSGFDKYYMYRQDCGLLSLKAESKIQIVNGF